MARRNKDADDQPLESGNSETEAPVPQKKRKQRASVVRSADESEEVPSGQRRGGRVPTPSSKKALIVQDTNDAKIKLLEKKLKKANKDLSKHAAAKTLARTEHHDSDSVESEENEDEEQTDIAFSSSIATLPSVDVGSHPSTASATPMRRVPSKAAATSSKSTIEARRAFLSRPSEVSSPLGTPRGGSVALVDVFLGAPAGGPIIGSKRPPSPSPEVDTFLVTKKPKVAKLIPAPFREGYMPGSRSKTGDYPPEIETVILRSMQEYECRISTIDAFPDVLVQEKWARSCWKNAIEEKADLDATIFGITDTIAKLIRKRGSRIRGVVASVIRSQVTGSYGFNRETTAKSISKNIVLSATLRANSAFHYKDALALSGFGQHKIISEIIHLCWFEDAKSLGVIFSRLFNPISLDTMALIFVAIEHSVKEWSTGKHIPSEFTEKTFAESYHIHQTDLVKWSSLNPSVVENIRKKLYMRACRGAGIDVLSKPVASLVGDKEVRAREELDGRTGDTDSEMSDFQADGQ